MLATSGLRSRGGQLLRWLTRCVTCRREVQQLVQSLPQCESGVGDALETPPLRRGRTQGRLANLIDQLSFISRRHAVIAELESAIGDATRAIEEMCSDAGELEHNVKRGCEVDGVEGNYPWGLSMGTT